MDVNLSSVPKRIRHYVPFEVSRIVFARPARRKSTLTPRFSIYFYCRTESNYCNNFAKLGAKFFIIIRIYIYICVCEFFQSKAERYLKYLKFNKSWMCEVFEIWKYFSRTELVSMIFFFLLVFKIFLVELPRRRGLRNKKYRQFFTSREKV